jgi:hypothetical protein
MADDRTDTHPSNPTEHWCEHEDCNKWGSLGYEGERKVIHWFCFEHQNHEYVPRISGRA